MTISSKWACSRGHLCGEQFSEKYLRQLHIYCIGQEVDSIHYDFSNGRHCGTCTLILLANPNSWLHAHVLASNMKWFLSISTIFFVRWPFTSSHALFKLFRLFLFLRCWAIMWMQSVASALWNRPYSMMPEKWITSPPGMPLQINSGIKHPENILQVIIFFTSWSLISLLGLGKLLFKTWP